MESGRNLGNINDIYIDPEKRKVSGLGISRGNFLQKKNEIITADEVVVWGEDVVLLKRTDVIRDPKDVSDFEKWMPLGNKLKGQSVVTVDGSRVGELDDIFIGPKGEVVGYQITNIKPEYENIEAGYGLPRNCIPADSITSMGTDVMIVDLKHVPRKEDVSVEEDVDR